MVQVNKKEGLGCKFHRILMMYIPLMYSLETRFLKRSKLGGVVWATEYMLPMLLVYFFSLYDNLWAYITIIIAVYNFYELGYIYNDCETIKTEKNPTLRLSIGELEHYEKHKTYIYLLRFVIGIVFTFYCFSILSLSLISTLMLWSIIPLYYIYNVFRGRINLYLIFVLTAYRYLCPITMLFDEDMTSWSFMMLLSYPVIKTIEICAGGKGQESEKWTRIFLKGFDQRFKFRIYYYLVLTLLSYYLFAGSFWILPLYYLTMRFTQFFMPKLGPR